MIYDMLDFVAIVLCYLILQNPRWYIKRRCMQHLTKLHHYLRIHDDIWHVWCCIIMIVVTCFYMCRITHGIEVFVDVFDAYWWCLFSFAGEISSCILKLLWKLWHCSCIILDGISSEGAWTCLQMFTTIAESTMISHQDATSKQKQATSKNQDTIEERDLTAADFFEGGPDTIDDYALNS